MGHSIQDNEIIMRGIQVENLAYPETLKFRML